MAMVMSTEPLKTRRFNRQQMFDVSRASKNAFQVDPATLNVDPNIKQGIDSV